MSNIIRVRIYDAQKRLLETIDDDGQNVVHKHQDDQPITWELDVGTKACEFTAINWVPPLAPPGTFKTPHFSHGGRTLRVNDENDKAVTAGNWGYQLFAVIDGLAYQTEVTATPPDGNQTVMAIRDPIIINR